MTLKIFQKGFNFSQDGPGNRLVYHLQGCNFKCPWCSNPESMSINGSVMCGSDGKKSFTCKEFAVDEVVDEVMRSRMMFFDGGGVTLTGGEPTLQFDAVKELLTRLKENGIHTAIETNASNPKLSELFDLLDYIMADFKHYDGEKHKKVIGVSNENVKNNFKIAAQKNKAVNVRIPLIGGFNADECDAEKFAEFFKTLNAEEFTYEFLKYHEYGKDKWEQIGKEYKLTETAFVTDETVNCFKTVFENNGLKVIRT